jgi:hypothetical protein
MPELSEPSSARSAPVILLSVERRLVDKALKQGRGFNRQ